MRKVSLIMVAAMLLSAGNLFAIKHEKPKKPKKLSHQIQDLLRDNNVEIKDKDLEACVLFTLNEDSELVVLSVNADNEELETFIKGRLNYRRMDVQESHEGQKFIVPIRITI